MADLRGGNKAHNAVHHTQTGAQNRHDGQLLACDHLSLRAADRGFDFNRFERQIAGDFVSHQHGDFVQQLAKLLGAGLLIAHQGELMLNQRMIHNMNNRHASSSLAGALKKRL